MADVLEWKKPGVAAGLSRKDNRLGSAIRTKDSEAYRHAQPIHLDGLFLGWLICRPSGQTEAALSFGRSLGNFNQPQQALNALIVARRGDGW